MDRQSDRVNYAQRSWTSLPNYGPPPGFYNIEVADVARAVFIEEKSCTTGQTIPHSGSQSSCSSKPMREAVVPEGPIIKHELETFQFTLELTGGSSDELHHASSIVQTQLQQEIQLIATAVSNELSEEIPYIKGTFEARLPISTSTCLLFDLLLNQPRFPPNCQRPTYGFSDSNIYSEALIDEVSCKLNSVNFGYKKGTKFFSHHMIAYKETFENPYLKFCRSNFKVDFDFVQQSVGITIHVWSNNASNPKYRDKMDYYTLYLEERSLSRLVLLYPLQQNRIQLVLEADHPVTIKKRQNNVEDILNNKPEIYNRPKFRCPTVYRGQTYRDRAPEGLVSDNRHILLDLEISWPEAYKLLSRLHHKLNMEIVACDLEIIDLSNYQYMPWIANKEPCGPYFEDQLGKALLGDPHLAKKSLILTMRLRALFGLGANIKDQLLLEQEVYDDFIKNVLRLSQQDFEKTRLLLESLIRFYMQSTHDAPFIYVYSVLLGKVARGELADPYAAIGSDYEIFEEIEHTPLGLVYKLPEIRFGNMVSRLLKRRKMLPMIRCSLRTETGQLLHWTLSGKMKTGERRIDMGLKKLLEGPMIDGIQILSHRFTFYAASGSQQREEGYFCMTSTDVDHVRQMVGDFEGISNPFKRSAREGQATSQSMECPVPIGLEMWRVEDDILSADGIVMSDGSGRISRQLAVEIYQNMKLGDCVPSGFQFRFLGCKGMLWIDDRLEGRRIVFRKSQQKFKPGTVSYEFLQVIKYTGPQITNLSANYINIIGQNAEIQDEGLERITEAVLQMNEKALMSLFEAMKDETRFRQTFSDLPFIIDHSKIGAVAGMVMNQDPFFRRSVSAFILKRLSFLLHKNRLPVDPDCGRSAFGGPDDREILGPEEVYFEATKCVGNKLPSPYTETVIYTGLGLIAKYPCCHQGDIRRVTFVDVPEYHGMRDKLIFSVKGSRPVADMLSGSDYDGDEFVILRALKLFPARNEVPMDYTPTVPENLPRTVAKMKEETWRAETYLNIVQDNNMGLAAICQLVKSDEFGQESQVALSLTKTSSMSLDMPKSGILPAEIRRSWIQDEAGNALPPEFPQRRPDFRPCSTKGPTYRSERINGDLHRLNRQLEFLISMRDEPQEITLNSAFCQIYSTFVKNNPPEINNLRNIVGRQLEEYNNRLQAIMTNGKVATEAELFSNCHFTGVGFDNQEEDFGNATHLQRAIDLFRTFRQRFFDDFGPYMEITRAQGPFDDENILKRSVISVTARMRQVAIVCYIMAYEMAMQSKNPLLSFGWIAYDVLGFALESCADSLHVEEESIYQIFENKLIALKYENDGYVFDYYSNLENYDRYLHSILTELAEVHGENIQLVLYGLIKVARGSGLLDTKSQGFNRELSRFVWIALLVGMGKIEGFEPVLGTNEAGQAIPIRIGNCFLSILGQLSSRKIFQLESRGYGEVVEGNIINIYGVISREDLTKIYEISRKVYFYLLISQNTAVFEGHLPYLFVRERVPRIIELPAEINEEEVCRVLKAKTGAADMKLKRKDLSNPNRFTVLYRGSSDCEEALRCLVEVPPLNDPKSEEEQNLYYAQKVYQSIVDESV